MSTYISKDEVMNSIGKTSLTSAQIERISQFILSSKNILDQFIGDVSYNAAKEEEIELREVYYDFWIAEFEMKSLNVAAINSINWISYTWVSGTDYKILGKHKNRIQVKDLFQSYLYWGNWDFPTFTVNIEAWWNDKDMPEGIKLAQLMLIEWMLAKQNGQTITKKKIWDKELQFASADHYEDFKTLIYLYMPTPV